MKRLKWYAIANVLIVAWFLIVWAVADARAAAPQQVIAQVFGPRAPLALRVARCESGLRPGAVSGVYGSVGLFQADFSAHHRRGESWSAFRRRMSNPRANVLFAYRLSRRGTNWSAWRWSARCWS